MNNPSEINDLLIVRLIEIIPADELLEFQKTESFRQSVMAAHGRRLWVLQKISGEWKYKTLNHIPTS